MIIPSKSEEIAILLQAAEKLGPDSYCGAWLKEVAQNVEADIRADMPPSPTISAWRKYCAEIEATAKERANDILSAAIDDANKRVDKARREVEYATSTLRACVRKLEGN
jgi:hypothetical protein